jgi:uncharacterized protein YcnI
MQIRAALAVLCLVCLVVPATAAAHVELSPDRVAPGSFTLFTVMSPNESEQPLTGVRLNLPEGLHVDGVADTPGFTTRKIEDARHRIVALSWEGGSVAPERLALFRFSASVGGAGSLDGTAVQTFADGSTRTWDSPVVEVAASGSKRDGLTLALAGVALALALAAAAACAVLLRRGRPA